MEGERGTTMKILSFLVLTLTLLSVNAYAFQVADSRYEGTYNSVDLNTVQTTFNGIRSRGAGGGAPVGTIVAVPSDAEAKFIEEDPDAWVLCDGREVPSGTALRSYMTHTPNLNGEKRFLQGTTGASSTVAAGLPNIKGYYYTPYYYSPYWNGITTGPFVTPGRNSTDGSRSRLYGSLDGGTGANTLGFDASLANSIYSDEIHTVQPEAYTVRYYIRCNE